MLARFHITPAFSSGSSGGQERDQPCQNLTHDALKPLLGFLNTHAVVIKAGAGLRERAGSSQTGREEREREREKKRSPETGKNRKRGSLRMGCSAPKQTLPPERATFLPAITRPSQLTLRRVGESIPAPTSSPRREPGGVCLPDVRSGARHVSGLGAAGGLLYRRSHYPSDIT